MGSYVEWWGFFLVFSMFQNHYKININFIQRYALLIVNLKGTQLWNECFFLESQASFVKATLQNARLVTRRRVEIIAEITSTKSIFWFLK